MQIGQMVHYVARGSADGVFPPVCRAAVVTEIGHGGAAGLAVLNPSGVFFHPLAMGGGVGNDDGHGDRDGAAASEPCSGRLYRPGTWHVHAT